MTIQQGKETQKTPIFAYLRKSTNKEEQKESLIQQEDGINIVVDRLGFNNENIRYFAETKSGFENKKRKKWEEMLKEIDKCKTPCILIARDTSRLSRNPKDNLVLTDRLYGDNECKQKIETIYFLGKNFEIIEWNNKTNKKALTDKLKQNYDESLETKEKSLNGILIRLSNSEFPYAAPKGLSSFMLNGRRILKQNEKISFVKRAFEMKAEGKTHKDISKYLRQYGEIRLSDKELTDRLFKNTVYIGEYTEKTTGSHFTNLQFFESMPPIPFSLWDKVQKCLGRKISQYGEKQEGHLLEAKIKSESGHVFSKYLAKGIYPAYKGKFKDATGNEEIIHIAEKRILESFLGRMAELVSVLDDRYSMDSLFGNPESYSEDEYDYAVKYIGKHFLIHHKKSPSETIDDFIHSRVITRFCKQSYPNDTDGPKNESEEDYCIRCLHKIGWTFEDLIESEYRWYGEDVINVAKKMRESEENRLILVRKVTTEDLPESEYRKIARKFTPTYDQGLYPKTSIAEIETEYDKISRELAIETFSQVLKKRFMSDTKGDRKIRDERIEGLKKQQQAIESEKKNYRRSALKMGYQREEIEEATRDMENDIKRIDEQILEFSEHTDMELYIERLPNILAKTVELSSNTLQQKEIGFIREDMKKLLEITTVELTISNKKELKVKLFDVLDALISSGRYVLEAPSGVEPDYEALQAPT